MRKGIDYSAIQQAGKQEKFVQVDGADNDVTEDEFLENRVEDYETYRILTNFLFEVLNNDVKTKKSLLSIVSDIVDTDDEKVLDAVVDWIGERIVAFLKHIGVSDSAIEDMLDDDDDISTSELLVLAELLTEKIDGDVRKFVAKALSQVDTDEDDDDVQMDWTSYGNKGQCMAGKDGKHPINKKTMRCKAGFSNGEKAYWRYANRYLNNGFIKGIKRGKKKTSAEVKKHMVKMRNHAHRALSDTMRKKDMKKRASAGMSIFSGYRPKKTSTQNIG